MRRESGMRLVLWWIVFTAGCVWIHDMIPGIDCFGPALLVLVHQHRYREAVWLTPIWIVINEGAGDLAFGLSVLWFGGLILIFQVLCLYLTSSNLIFLISLSLLAGIWHSSVIQLMSTLQEVAIPVDRILLQGIETALLFPLLWAAMTVAFKRWGKSRYVSL
jgi:hypothetical protein